MDQKTTNGNGKASWRERLGIGKELPKIAGEFGVKAVAEPKLAQPKVAAAPKGPLPVVKPAPMAPRPAPGIKSKAAVGRPAITPQFGGESIAERLKSQRAAAEKLAEQRVAAAREAPAVSNGAAAGEKPKFSFVEDEASQKAAPTAAPKREAPAPVRPAAVPAPSPILPPRTPLGGEPLARTAVPPPRPATYQPQFPPPGKPQSYRPLDPPGYPPSLRPGTPPPRPVPPQPSRPYVPSPSYSDAGPGDSRLGARQSLESYRRPADGGYEDDGPRRPRSQPNRARRQEPEDELDDVFDDEQPGRRPRASAQDYGRAYREYEDEFAERDRKRSRGPLFLLLALVAAAALAGAGVWYYNTKIKPMAAGGAQSDNVPVVAEPETPAKFEPDPVPPPTGTGDQTTPATATKQFYDRIVGDQVIEGNTIAPTEEVPAPPSQGSGGEPSAVPLPAPEGTAPGATDAAPTQDNGLGTATVKPAADEPGAEQPLPLPLPPAGGQDTQGSVPGTAAPETDVAAVVPAPAAAPPGEPSIAAIPAPGDVPGSTPEAAAPPAPASDGNPLAAQEQPEPPKVDEVTDHVTEATVDPEPAVKPAKRKAEAKAKKKPKPEQEGAATGTEPVVLVPPGDGTAAAAPPEAQAGEERSGSFFAGQRKRLTGRGAENAPPDPNAPRISNFKGGNKAPGAQAAPDQVASIEDTVGDPVATPETSQDPDRRFVVQLGSFRTEAEARAEMARLRSRTNALDGVSTRVSRASLVGSTRYRIVSSGLANRTDGNRVCEALLAANEQNCSVKQQ